MFKQLKEKESKKLITNLTISGIIVASFVAIIINLDAVGGFVKTLFSVLSPFVWGTMFALISIRPAIFFEKKLPSSMKFETRRLISSIISTLIIVLVISLVFVLAMPRIIDSVASLSNLISNFTSNPTTWIESLQKSLGLSNGVVNSIYEYSNKLVQGVWNIIQKLLPNVVSATVATVSGLLDFIIGFIVCLYILIDRRQLAITFKRLGKAYLSKKHYEKARSIMYLTLDKFTNFFSGKVLDSLIIGVICFICMLFIDTNYAALVSVIVGITNIVPFFGPFIGAIPCALLLLIVEPYECLVFVIMILILQQLDGNVIGPKILGGSVGLSSLWIMFALVIGGGFFGFFGMLLGVPVFSVIYYVIKQEVDEKLAKQK